MAKELTFHSDFQRVTLCIDGVAYSMNAEVEVVVKRPAKLDPQSIRVWEESAKSKAQAVTVEQVPSAVK